jgi:hypothetical protein
MAVDRGALVIGDISGYTGYLNGVELEHSHDVIADLLDTTVQLVPRRKRRVQLHVRGR